MKEERLVALVVRMSATPSRRALFLGGMYAQWVATRNGRTAPNAADRKLGLRMGERADAAAEGLYLQETAPEPDQLALGESA